MAAASPGRQDAYGRLARSRTRPTAIWPCSTSILCGERADDVADLLAARGVPFIFATGYGEERIAERHRSAPLVELYTRELLRRALLDIVPP